MKEYVKPKDGKRKLYFSLDMQNFITYTLEQKTTCDNIYKENVNLIESNCKKLYNDSNIDLSNFDFFLIDLKDIKKSQGYFLSKIKLNRNLYIYNFLQNPKTILCFMPKSQIKIRKNINKCNDNIYQKENEKFVEIKNKYLNDKHVEDFFVNKTVFLYDYKTKIYNKYKANLSEKQFTIHTPKKDTIIYAQDILSINYYEMDHPLINTLTVNSGFKPPIYAIMKSEENQWVMGFKLKEKIKKWKKGFDFVLINLAFFNNDIDFNIEINNLKKEISQNESKIITEPINRENIMNNKYRKILFYKFIKNKKILEIVECVLKYKKYILNKDYEKATNKIGEIIAINEIVNKNEKKDIDIIITEEKINELLNLYNKLNEILKEKNKNILEDLLKYELFDNIFEEINKLYIDPVINKINKEISNDDSNIDLNTKIHLENIVAYNYLQNYNMEKIDSFLEL